MVVGLGGGGGRGAWFGWRWGSVPEYSAESNMNSNCRSAQRGRYDDRNGNLGACFEDSTVSFKHLRSVTKKHQRQ